MKFVADTMLGRLAKWLRVLGYDTHYQSHYHQGQLANLLKENYYLITRDRKKSYLDARVLFLDHDKVGEQLTQLISLLQVKPDSEKRFLRCLRCNVPLESVSDRNVRDKVPEYVYYEKRGQIKFCRNCRRYFWPGSHRERMVKQLHAWGLTEVSKGE